MRLSDTWDRGGALGPASLVESGPEVLSSSTLVTLS
jgi:hypothetical protein